MGNAKLVEETCCSEVFESTVELAASTGIKAGLGIVVAEFSIADEPAGNISLRGRTDGGRDAVLIESWRKVRIARFDMPFEPFAWAVAGKGTAGEPPPDAASEELVELRYTELVVGRGTSPIGAKAATPSTLPAQLFRRCTLSVEVSIEPIRPKPTSAPSDCCQPGP